LVAIFNIHYQHITDKKEGIVRPFAEC